MALLQTEVVHYVKDTSSGALLNTDDKGYELHKQQRRRRIEEKQSLETRMQTLENNVALILQLLQESK